MSSLAWAIESGEVLWREPDDEETWTPIRFSPDGGLLCADLDGHLTRAVVAEEGPTFRFAVRP